MPFIIAWHIPLRVVSVTASGVISHDDLDAYTTAAAQMLAEAQAAAPGRKVYNVFDGTQIESLPLVYQMFARALPVVRMPNLGPLYYVTENRAHRHIIELTAHILSISLRTFNNREAALHAAEAALAADDLRTGQPGSTPKSY
jgi:hypothetical protein